MNWAGNYAYRANTLHRPATLEEVREIVAATPRLRVLGSRHSFTAIADSEELLSLDRMPVDIVVDSGRGVVSFGAALRYGDLAQVLATHDLGLANLASLPHISVAGAVATATHGSGIRNGNLATSVAALQMVCSDGSVVEFERGDPDFDGIVVALGAAGAVTRVTLDVEPAYEIRQRVFEGLSWDALGEHLDQILGAGYSVSAFTRWTGGVDQVWVKSRVTGDPEIVVAELFGARASTVERHPILGLDPVNCTPQLGVPGGWSERLPHFRMGFTPSSGEEIQSEFHVPRRHALAAIEAMIRVGPTISPLIQVSEIRTVAADTLWMSPQYGTDTFAIHFTWMPEQAAVERALEHVEAALEPFEARPHWGKLFRADAATAARPYQRRDDFAALIERLDPRGAFRNEWLETRVLGSR
jgi:xylitol oxidase